MSRQDFIDALKRALYGKTDDFTLADHIQYYESYIAQEVATGKSEQEVLNELGDPRLIARTLLEAADTKASSYTEYIVTDQDDSSPEPEVRIRRYEGWKAVAVTVFLILIVLLILVLVFQILVALLPLLIVIGAVGWLIRKMTSQ